jgi:AraC-like DNA-binding protein
MSASPVEPSLVFMDSESTVGEINIFHEPSVDNYYPLPPIFGESTFRAITARQDINVFLVEHHQTRELVRVETNAPIPLIKIGFAMKVASSLSRIEGIPKGFPITSGGLCIASPAAIVQCEVPPGGEFDFITLAIGPNLILDLIEEYDARPSTDFWRVATEPGSEPSQLIASFDAETRMIAERLRTTRYKGAVQRLYIEGVTLELLAASLQRLLRIEDLSRKDHPISAKNVRHVREACELLDCRFRDPPTLAEMAKELKVSVAKLKRDFKRVQGMGVHQYVIARRMDHARRFIEEEGMSCKEASYLVGYRSQSHFTEVYKYRYGRSPR